MKDEIMTTKDLPVKVGQLEVAVKESNRRLGGLEKEVRELNAYLRNDLPHKISSTYATKTDILIAKKELRDKISDVDKKYRLVKAIVYGASGTILVAFLATLFYYIGWQR